MIHKTLKKKGAGICFRDFEAASAKQETESKAVCKSNLYFAICRIEARFKLQNLGDYKDSRALLETVEIPAFKESLSKMQTGHTVTFGSYEQDNDPDNGKEPIEWIVLNDSRSGYVILISSSILDVRQFNAERDYTVWEDSDLRKWLNGEFFREAFPAEKQAFMDAVPLANPDDAWGTDNGNDTNDYVFVLNMYERQDWKLLNTAPATLYARVWG